MIRTTKLNKRLYPAQMVVVMLVLVVYPFIGKAGEISPVEVTLSPELNLPDLDRKMRTLNEDGFAGKVILINFWASWCRPCIKEIPAIRRLIKTMTDKQLPFDVIGVNVGEAERRVATAAERLAINYTVLLDRDSSVFRKWGANVLPTAFVLDSKGQKRFIARGPVEWDSAETVELLMKLAKPPVSD